MSLGVGQDGAGDPWSWGVEENSDSQQSSDWNNGWIQQEFSQQSREPPHHFSATNVPNQNLSQHQPSNYGNVNFSVNNNTRAAHRDSPGKRNRPWSHGNKYPPHSAVFPNTATLFNNRQNNNSIPDVENKEIVPPDFHNSAKGHPAKPEKSDFRPGSIHPSDSAKYPPQPSFPPGLPPGKNLFASDAPSIPFPGNFDPTSQTPHGMYPPRDSSVQQPPSRRNYLPPSNQQEPPPPIFQYHSSFQQSNAHFNMFQSVAPTLDHQPDDAQIPNKDLSKPKEEAPPFHQPYIPDTDSKQSLSNSKSFQHHCSESKHPFSHQNQHDPANCEEHSVNKPVPSQEKTLQSNISSQPSRESPPDLPHKKQNYEHFGEQFHKSHPAAKDEPSTVFQQEQVNNLNQDQRGSVQPEKPSVIQSHSNQTNKKQNNFQPMPVHPTRSSSHSPFQQDHPSFLQGHSHGYHSEQPQSLPYLPSQQFPSYNHDQPSSLPHADSQQQIYPSKKPTVPFPPLHQSNQQSQHSQPKPVSQHPFLPPPSQQFHKQPSPEFQQHTVPYPQAPKYSEVPEFQPTITNHPSQHVPAGYSSLQPIVPSQPTPESPGATERTTPSPRTGVHEDETQPRECSPPVGQHLRTPSDGQDPPALLPHRGQAAGQDRTVHSPRPDNQETLSDNTSDSLHHQMRFLTIQNTADQENDSCPLDRNQYLEISQLSCQVIDAHHTNNTEKQPEDVKDGSGEREVPGEAEPRGSRVVLGQMTSTPIAASSPPPSRSTGEERDVSGGRSSMERMVVGERREGSEEVVRSPSEEYSRPNHRSNRHRHRPATHHRDSSYEEDEYASDRDRRGYRRDERHRRRRELGSSEYMSDEDYEYDRRMYYRRDRRRDPRDYSPEYRRDYYREDPRRTRGREYYGRDYDDESYYKERSSRPSSRTGSDYRRANMDYQQRSAGHYFPPDPMAGYGVRGNNDFTYNQEYFEIIRRTNPVYYAVWYQNYMNRMSASSAAAQSYTNDRGSVHSGQSSNNRLNITTPNNAESNVNNLESFEDYTPRLFSTAHVRGSFDNQGRLVIVDANYPLDGQMPSVQLNSVEVEQDANVKEFLECPGPFIPGVTHRSTVLQYLKKMSDQAVRSSEKLLYDLVHLTVKSNGNPNVGDISELLVESYKQNSDSSNEQKDQEVPVQVSQTQLVSRFRDLLQQGNKTEALDWAMENGGWGHALFLASKMDARTHNSVMLQFANSLSVNDPLQTLYQLMSGIVPQACTSCGDKKWSDWRPHLAMILSNSTNSELDRKAIITLGDSLTARNRYYAAHFCYLIAQVPFAEFSSEAKLVLLGSATNQPFDKFFTYKSFLLTLCYEYGIKQGIPTYSIPSLQSYKMLAAYRLVDYGRSRSALQYCELSASEILSNRQIQSTDVVHLLVDLSSKLKMVDPQLALSNDITAEPEWLTKLRQFAAALPETEEHNQSNTEVQKHPNLQVGVGDEMDGYGVQYSEQQPLLAVSEPSHQGQVRMEPFQPPGQTAHMRPPPGQQGLHPQEVQSDLSPPNMFNPSLSQPPNQQFNGYQQAEHAEPIMASEADLQTKTPWNELPPVPQEPVTMKSSVNYFQSSEQQFQSPKPIGISGEAVEEEGSKEVKKKPEAGGGGNSSSWFGGFLGKLTLKPKNQMVLPDDKDPKIVFDAKLKRWVDKDGGESEAKDLKPPPKMPLGPSVGGSPGSGPPGAAAPLPSMASATSHANKYKLQKGKSMKSNYVDVLGGGKSTKMNSKDIEPLLPSVPQQTSPNYFIPAPVDSNEGGQFNSQPALHNVNDGNKMGDMVSHPGPPMMYNPANFTS